MVEQSLAERAFMCFMSYIGPLIFIPLFAIIKPIVILFTLAVSVLEPKYTLERHTEKVKDVQKQVLDWNANGRKTQMCLGRPGWQSFSIRTPIYKNTLTRIDVLMGDLIQIDYIRRSVTVEPLMNMGTLTSILVPMGWTLPVVPELNDLTVGGLMCGAGIETSSHKYGLIHNICISCEMVLANGEVVKCSKEENSDLFHAIPGSCGTLGFLTAAELMIIPAEKYMKLEYIPVHSLDEAVSTFESQTHRESGNDFVEGIMYSLDKGVIMVGNMAAEAEAGKVNSVGRWYKPWFYKHAESFLKKNPSQEYIEYIPLRDYYHRHTRSLFWETAFMIPYGNSPLFRYLFGWVLPFRVFLIKLMVPESVKAIFDRNHVAQDFVVPIELLKESLLLTHDEMQVYPIWLCPAKLINEGPYGPRFLSDKDEMYVDIGIYGLTKLKEYELVKSARRWELFCIENRGYQALYADICLTLEEFGQMFDSTHYFAVREKYNCSDAFPNIYEKVCRAARR